MRLWSVLSRLLTILAVVGLVSGAVTAPAAAGLGSSAMSMAMADGMPPCDQNTPDCGAMKACPYVSASFNPTLLGAPTASTVVVLLTSAGVLAPHDDWLKDGLALLPPARPPRV